MTNSLKEAPLWSTLPLLFGSVVDHHPKTIVYPWSERGKRKSKAAAMVDTGDGRSHTCNTGRRAACRRCLVARAGVAVAPAER